MTRRLDIDRAKGLAIMLVVFGHIVARQDPAHVHWYLPLRRAVYAFHMPFFFYLSGMVSWLAGHVRAQPAEWPPLAAARARRLLLPFVLMGTLIVIGKLLAARFMVVDNPPTGMISGLVDLVWNPAHSPAFALWYLFVLFALSLLAPALLWAIRGRLVPLLLAFAALEFVPLPWTLYLAVIARYGLFYAAGICAGSLGDAWTGWIDRRRPPLLALFCTGFVLIAADGAAIPFAARLLTLGIVAMPALHALVRFPGLSSDRILATIGRYSLMIYLFNTSFIGLAKGVLLRLASWNGEHFLGFACALMAAGLLGPILLKRTLFRAIPVLDRMTR
ncbi:acyltransferase [Acidiphilium sp. AL]|uniref:Acyltransferase n=1 Tax=Acidiphilium iwatense TaxID=768198 RepID=A0ABS9DZQ0_9PROT|nr:MULTISPECIES: acyltransferase [Acidiphilium]MCF3948226.1 acyltransferase [Acidiphilium iwatense]MCU4161338.1 acyltransferase [Acidiphilium sp. AL]